MCHWTSVGNPGYVLRYLVEARFSVSTWKFATYPPRVSLATCVSPPLPIKLPWIYMIFIALGNMPAFLCKLQSLIK